MKQVAEPPITGFGAGKKKGGGNATVVSHRCKHRDPYV